MFESSNGGKECYYGSGWDPTVPLSQIDNLGASLMVSHGDLAIPSSKGLTATSQFLHYSSDASAFGGGAVNSYCLPGAAQNSGVFGLQTHHSNKEPQISGERSMIASSNAKRKRNSGGNMQRDLTGEISEMKEFDEKKQKIEESGSSDQSNKQTKDNCSGEEDSKGYIHVRARRGQATNSHSLAERVRREKINDRMRLLQELVPGCNKITGKAVMLDEIINYVQSLQQQVEFLSMKLATVTPELNFDFEQVLAKDNLHSRGILGFNTHHSAPGIHQEALPLIPNTTSLYHQGMWDGELHHMSFDLNPTTGNVGPNGR